MIPFRPVWIAAVGLAAVLVGCSGAPRLASQPSTPVNLTGHWVVEPSASDDAVALIKAALPHPKQQRKSRYDLWGNEVREGDEPGTYPPGSGRGADRRSGDGGGRSGRGSGRAGSDAGGDSAGYSAREAAPAWGRMRPYDYVAYFAAPPQRLDISQEATVVRVGSGDRMRAFIPGDRDPINLTDRWQRRFARRVHGRSSGAARWAARALRQRRSPAPRALKPPGHDGAVEMGLRPPRGAVSAISGDRSHMQPSGLREGRDAHKPNSVPGRRVRRSGLI